MTKNSIKIVSFGFKYGPPYPEADIRADLRNRIRNFQDHLPKGAVGTDKAVVKAVLGSDQNRKVMQRYTKRARDLLKSQSTLTVAFGCKSGIHRSVVFAEELAKQLTADGHTVIVQHLHLRDAGNAR